MYSKFTKQFVYAKTNGFKGDIAQYVENLYKSYGTICNRNEIAPMSFADWVINA